MISMNLRELQDQFVRGVLFDDTSDLMPTIHPGGTLTAAGALSVYRTAYFARLTDALGEMYEAVWRLLGDEDFMAASRDYIQKHPSRFYNLSRYGESFADFLLVRFPEHPLIPELAQFEWKFAQLFHTAEEPGLEPQELAGLTPQSRVHFVRSSFFFPAKHPIYSFWESRAHPDPPEIDIDLPEPIVAYKKHSQIYVKQMSETSMAVMLQLLGGETIEKALDSAESPDEVKEVFLFIGQAGLIARIESASS